MSVTERAAASESRPSRAVMAVVGVLLIAALGGCTSSSAVAGSSVWAVVAPDRLCPDTGTARPDAADLVACISAKASQYWTAQLGQTVERTIVVEPDPETLPEGCRTFLSFGTAFYCGGNTTVYITDTALDRDAIAFGDSFPYAILGTVAHEFGHVVQDLVDQPELEGSRTDAQSRFIEQQADCLAGVWVRLLTRLGEVNPVEVRSAFEGQLTIIHSLPVPPELAGYDETETHGTVEQRLAAYDEGVAGGSGSACDLVGFDGD